MFLIFVATKQIESKFERSNDVIPNNIQTFSLNLIKLND